MRELNGDRIVRHKKREKILFFCFFVLIILVYLIYLYIFISDFSSTRERRRVTNKEGGLKNKHFLFVFSLVFWDGETEKR